MNTENTTDVTTMGGDSTTEQLQHVTETNQFLTFCLGGEQYGVDILRVQEIKGWTPVTRIPNTPEHMRGVLNLRGTIVPIIDIRIRFNLENADYTPLTVVIVLSVETALGNRVIGIVVDAVSDVLNVPKQDMKPTPDFGSKVDAQYIKGLAAMDENMVMILDIDKMLSLEELESFHGVSEQQLQ